MKLFSKTNAVLLLLLQSYFRAFDSQTSNTKKIKLTSLEVLNFDIYSTNRFQPTIAFYKKPVI